MNNTNSILTTPPPSGLPGKPPWQTRAHFAATLRGIIQSAEQFLPREEMLGFLDDAGRAVRAVYDRTLESGTKDAAAPTAQALAESLQALLQRSRGRAVNEAVIVPFANVTGVPAGAA